MRLKFTIKNLSQSHNSYYIQQFVSDFSREETCRCPDYQVSEIRNYFFKLFRKWNFAYRQSASLRSISNWSLRCKRKFSSLISFSSLTNSAIFFSVSHFAWDNWCFNLAHSVFKARMWLAKLVAVSPLPLLLNSLKGGAKGVLVAEEGPTTTEFSWGSIFICNDLKISKKFRQIERTSASALLWQNNNKLSRSSSI